tara:strand:- start:742 stop:1722 length:981 start_codon:yes stop_codon:yes gene_type:complete
MKKKRNGIGIALSGGMSKGFAHIGVLKVLEDNNIPISHVSGTSMGAIIGALYCSGMEVEDIEDFAINTEWKELFNFTIPKNYLVRKHAIRSLMRGIFKNKTFAQLKIPLHISGTQLIDGQKIVFSSGNIVKAIMASMSLPGILKPELVNDVEIVDGGMVDPLPIASLQDKCKKIIAVDVSTKYREQLQRISHVKYQSTLVNDLKEDFIRQELDILKDTLKHKKIEKVPKLLKFFIIKILDWVLTPAAIIDFMAGRTPPEIAETIIQSYTIVLGRVSQLTLKAYPYDVLIQPKQSYMGWFEFDKAKEIIEDGAKGAREHIRALKKLV